MYKRQNQLSARRALGNLCCYPAPSTPLPACFSSLPRTDQRSSTPALPSDSIVPSPSTASFWGWCPQGTPFFTPTAHQLDTSGSWLPVCIHPLFLSVSCPWTRSLDRKQLFQGRGNSGQHIPSKPRTCLLASQLTKWGMGCPTFWRLWAALEKEELSWATY